ncbi:MAG: hypothetical protein IPJ75_00785 [Ignavibacteriales bacterium]|nr:hypothetical protein [Ignavibacteriales bacterium]
METNSAGSYLLKNQKGSWRNFDYFEAIHADLGIQVLLFRSKEEMAPLHLDKLKKLRKLGFESVLKVFDIYYYENRLYVATEFPGQMSLFDYFYTLNRPLEPYKAIDLVLSILLAIEDLHNLGYAIGYLDESIIFFIHGKRIKIGGNWLVHYENLKAIDEFELATEDSREAKLQDVARCGAILFRLLNQDTLLTTNLSFSKVLQSSPASIPAPILEIILKAVNIEKPSYSDASGMIYDLKAIRPQFEPDLSKNFAVPADAGRVESGGSRVKVTAILKGSDTIAESTADNLIKEKSHKPKLSMVNLLFLLLIVVISAGGLLYLLKGSLFGSKPNEQVAAISENLAVTPKKMQPSDNLTVQVNETLEIILQHSAAGRNAAATSPDQNHPGTKSSIEYFVNLYDGIAELKIGNLDSAYAKIDRAALISNRSVTELDAIFALGCYSIKKNDGDNAWLYISRYSELMDIAITNSGNIPKETKAGIDLKKEKMSKILENFK